MSLTKTILMTVGAAGLMAATPASAAIYDYTMTNGDVLSINTDTQSATFTGAKIDASMTSASFAGFTGGAAPRFNYILDSLDGTRLIGGVLETDNPVNSTTTHPQRLKALGAGPGVTKFNLWAWWGDPITGGDYITYLENYTTDVPEPGMLGLFGIGLAAIGWRRRRKVRATAA